MTYSVGCPLKYPMRGMAGRWPRRWGSGGRWHIPRDASPMANRTFQDSRNRRPRQWATHRQDDELNGVFVESVKLAAREDGSVVDGDLPGGKASSCSRF